MYRVNEFLTPAERLDAMRLGGLGKLASMGMKPSDMEKLAGKESGGLDVLGTALKTSILVGAPVGALWYVLSNSLKNDSKKTRQMKATLDHYNDVVAENQSRLQGLDMGKTAGDLLDGGTMDDVLRVGGKGLAIGAGAAATVALIRQVIEANRQKKAKEKRYAGNIDPNTVVLRVRKQAEDKCLKIEGPESRELHPVSTVGPRELDGRFASAFGKRENTSEKSAGFLSDSMAGAGGILAAGGGAVLGYTLVSKLAQKLEQQRLKKQIEAAQTEYINLLDGKTKTAEAFSKIFLFDDPTIDEIDGELRKEAGVPTDIYDIISNAPRTAKGVSAGMMAAWILGAGASAYVAKRLLENKFDQQEEEEPEKQTRILFKASSSEFEIPPEHMLATIGVLRDCIADSIPEGVKTAASAPDYSVLDDIEKMDGGRQWLLDQYASQNGLQRDQASDFKIPLSMKLKYGKTLSDIRKNPDKHSAGINSKVMGMMQNDPEGWFKLLGSDRNNDIVRMKANEQIANMGKNGGFMGFLSKIPFLGGFIKNIMNWYMNSVGGRRMLARSTLGQMGVTGDRAKGILSGYDFTDKGWAPTAVKQAGLLGGSFDDGIEAFLARTKTLHDKTNKDVIKAIESLRTSKSKKGKSVSKTVIEFDSDLGDLLSDEDKAKIITGLTKGK